MKRKTGRKATYIQYGGHEVREIVDGNEIGLSYDETTQSYYVMLPQKTGRTKRKWLGRDKEQAVMKFRTLVVQLRREIEKYVVVEIDDKNNVLTRVKPIGIPESPTINDLINNIDKIDFEESGAIAFIKESEHIEWLKQELQNPSQLAKKTGLEFFNNIEKYVFKKPIPFSKLYENYTHSKHCIKSIDPDEMKKTKAAWDRFLSIIKKTNLEQVALEDIKAFEKHLRSCDYADKTISHYRNRVMKILKYNLNEYVDTFHLLKVLEFFSKWEKLEIGGSSTISAQAISQMNFNLLYENANTEMKAVLLLCLNTATYLREVARFRTSDIDLGQQTLMTHRNKTGQCRKFAYLWDRTVEALRTYLGTRKDNSDVLFIARHGGEYKHGTGLRTKFWDLRNAAGLLHIKFNHLRDTFETIGKEIGVSQYHIDMVMGHSSGKTSERYTHRRIHNELMNSCLAVEKDFFKIP